MSKGQDKRLARDRKHKRARKKIFGTAARPRLNVFRSPRNIYAQLVDDEAGRTTLAISSLSPELREIVRYGGNVEAAKLVGKALAEKCQEKGIKQVVFDRGGYLYHGRVKALAEGAREGGLKF
ncbi:50S ribosomal protein L18 [candidate division NPL-UPA2 bacterium]|nr:50S ribosomal protein L18 [candidate division NPL-UPA2 bacterium]